MLSRSLPRTLAARSLTNAGSGEDRTMCLCNIFDRIKEENGGSMPPIDNWQSIYADLGCAPTGLQDRISSFLND